MSNILWAKNPKHIGNAQDTVGLFNPIVISGWVWNSILFVKKKDKKIKFVQKHHKATTTKSQMAGIQVNKPVRNSECEFAQICEAFKWSSSQSYKESKNRKLIGF